MLRLCSANWVRVLLKLGCDPSVALPGGVTALQLATKMKHKDVVEVLCDGGADPHQGAANVPSALSIALIESNFALYAILVRYFIKGHERGDEKQAAEFEALRAAIAKGSAPFVEGLLSDLPSLPVGVSSFFLFLSVFSFFLYSFFLFRPSCRQSLLTAQQQSKGE